MGRIIQKSGGKTTVYVNGVNINGLTPLSNTYYVGVDLASGHYEKLNPTGTIVNLEGNFTGGTVPYPTNFTGGLSATTFSATTYLNLPVDTFTGGTVNGATNFTSSLSATTFSATTYLNLPPSGCINVTYSELVTLINGDELSAGVHYLITDFRTCYDQPDFDYYGNPVTIGNYKEGPVESILVLATSANTISVNAYQPQYPNDKIQYDWTWDTTEVTDGIAYGRITERIDEFNNRTDYDHRNILFKRYRLFTYRPNQPLNGTIELLGDGTINGIGTYFTELNVGDVIFIPTVNPGHYEVVAITDDLLMIVSGDTIPTAQGYQTFYKAIEETNDNDAYFSFKRMNVKTDDFIEYTTFGDAISIEYAKNTYVGNFANNYTNIGSGTFILANNVFLEGQYESNKFGDYCYNNTFGTDNQNNIWGDWCYENVSTNDIDDNIIGHYFNNNLLNVNLTSNHIGNEFYSNKLLAENGEAFEDNIIGNGFTNNTIYSWFYKNEILDNFNNNVIGDFGHLDNFKFYRNYIRNNFNENTIRLDFQNNQIGTNFQNNIINGEFVGNTILNGFNNNTTGNYFNLNNIGNGFNNNYIYDNFYENTTDYYFYSNVISNGFNNNNVGSHFEYNNPTNLSLFGWDDLSTISTRTYDTLRNSLDGNVGNNILGKELVMRVISTSQYFKIKFTQWTQGGNGGGFQYERQEVDSNGNPQGAGVIFTKNNYNSEVDVVVPGVVELTRDNQGGLYNTITDTPPFNNQWPGPGDTEWNSIYTQSNNGERFAYNKIGSDFKYNTIGSDFGFGGSVAQGNVINDAFQYNTIGQFMYNNVIGNYFTNNTVGNEFENNTIKNYFIGNTVGDSFTSNDIGNFFGNYGNAEGSPLQNVIFNNFSNNKIGDYFGNSYNFPIITGGTTGDGGNVINDNFQFNVIGDNFIFNAIDEGFRYNQIGNHFWLNVFGVGTESNILGNYFVGNGGGDFPLPMGDYFASNKFGNYVAFNWFTGLYFQNNNIGNFFGTAAEFPATSNRILDNFQNNTIGNYFGYDPITPGDGGNYIEVDFQNNKIGNNFTYNATYGTFSDNVINNDFTLNQINFNFNFNKIGNLFSNNLIDFDFAGNDVPYFFYSSSVSAYCQNNKFGSGNFFNTIGANFYGNTIGNSFIGNDILDGFDSNKIGNSMGGFINGNTIGNDFMSNNIGDYFRSNEIGDSFISNQIGNVFDGNISLFNNFMYNRITDDFTSNIIYDNFNYNRIDTAIDTVDFTTYLSGVTSISFSFVGIGAPGTYTDLASTGGSGSSVTFNVVVDAFSAVTSVSINDMGQNYITGNTLTIDGALYGGVGGVDSISISVLDVNIPSVYQTYNCQLFEIGGGAKKLSYYDDSSVLVITDVNL